MTSLEKQGLLQKDRLFLFSGLAAVTVFAWVYMLHMAWAMPGKGMHMSKPCLMNWGSGYLAHIFIMWSIMMVAMMLPSSTPMVVMFATVNKQRSKLQGPLVPTWLFVLGYLIIWTAYSALATMTQWGLHIAALLSHAMVITNPIVGGVLLVAAGVFQWTPFRDACMTQCRSPLGFIMTEWREGRRGALMMGLKHGIYCVRCCWLLMALSFVLGVMNMLWMAALTAFMLLEKITDTKWISRTAGVMLVIWGLWVTAEIIR